VPSSICVAVVGAGVAGATCAQALSASGCAVQVVDKARGAGGRLGTRRLEWLDAGGRPRSARLDHGAPSLSARDAGFRCFLAAASDELALAPWTPRLAAGSRPLEEQGLQWLPGPDMPSWCRALLRDVPTTWNFAVDRLRQSPLGWRLDAAGQALPGHFDAVVLALPPAQAAPLLAPHRGDWAQRASLALMQPCWTLMGVAQRPARGLAWNVARPEQGPLAWVMHHDDRPGRETAAGEIHWVAHARAGWSRQHLEQPAEWVLPRLQTALQDWLGEPIAWQHAVVHRWRYAMPQAGADAPARHCWWDGARGLGVCGDFLGGAGVEGAWLSAQALIEALRRDGAATAVKSWAVPDDRRRPRPPARPADAIPTPSFLS
jgi:predicted NAD/FAD-dependent oxidoreductase